MPHDPAIDHVNHVLGDVRGADRQSAPGCGKRKAAATCCRSVPDRWRICCSIWLRIFRFNWSTSSSQAQTSRASAASICTRESRLLRSMAWVCSPMSAKSAGISTAVSDGQGGRLAGDVHRHVADPLQVVVDLQGRNQLPQVDRHRLVQGQRLEAFLLEVDLPAVDVFVHRLHFRGQARRRGRTRRGSPSGPAPRRSSRSAAGLA